MPLSSLLSSSSKSASAKPAAEAFPKPVMVKPAVPRPPAGVGGPTPLPAIPPIGRPESFYARQVHVADKANDIHAHEAYKVAQYVTLGVDPALPWAKKLRFFEHALRRHCRPPPLPAENVWLFYESLRDLVRSHCGEQALFLASSMDDRFAERCRCGESRDLVCDDADRFFGDLMPPGAEKPDHFNAADWEQLRLIRDQWV